MTNAQSLHLQIKELQNQLEIEQYECTHPNLNMDEELDDIYADPFSDVLEIKEYQCPDCLLKIVK